MSDMSRAPSLGWWVGCWVTATTGCLLAGGPEDTPAQRNGSTLVQPEGEEALGPERTLDAKEARATLWPKLRGQAYPNLGARTRDATEALLSAATLFAIGSAGPESLPTLAGNAGLRLERWTIDDEQYLVILEDAKTRGGVGSFVLRIGPPSAPQPERLLQAPHAHFDAGTGRIAVQLLFEHPARFRGLFSNSLHRYVQVDGRKKKRDKNPADVCHNVAHPFVAATEAAVRALSGAEVIQLHGYADDHELPGKPGAWAVVSPGDPEAGSPSFDGLVDRLRATFDVPIARYPDDVEELGGTTNVIGIRVRAVGGSSFVHLELSSSFRQQLRRHRPWRQRLATALAPVP